MKLLFDSSQNEGSIRLLDSTFLGYSVESIWGGGEFYEKSKSLIRFRVFLAVIDGLADNWAVMKLPKMI